MDPSRRVRGGVAASDGGAEFDRCGPSFDGTLLLTKVGLGLEPHARHDLHAILGACDAGVDYDRVEAMLSAIAEAMNRGDLASAAIMTGRLPLPAPSPSADAAGRLGDPLGKASPDDPDHPGWPAKSPDGEGGQFRPKDGAGEAGAMSRAEHLKRLAARKGLRAVLRRVLTAKRLARVAAEVGAEAIPGAELPATVVLIEDMSELLEEVVAETKDVEAAVSFVKRGPQTLEELAVSPHEESFSSYGAFEKVDLDTRFGAAGDGYEYHHIVEQGSKRGSLAEEQLRSTSNIVKIPRLLHEEISSVYGASKQGEPALREALRGRPFDVQRDIGLRILRQVGVLAP